MKTKAAATAIQLLIPEEILKIRNDCQIGQWKIGDEPFTKEMDFIAIKIRRFIGGLGKTKLARWFQLWMVPMTGSYAGVLSVTYIKSQSLERLSNKLIQLQAQGNKSTTTIFTSSFEPKNGELGRYFILNFDVRDPKNEEQHVVEDITTIDESMLWDPDSTEHMICVDGLTGSDKQMIYEALRDGVELEAIREMMKQGIVQSLNQLIQPIALPQ